MKFLLLLLLLFVVVVSASVHFRVRRFAEDGNRVTLVPSAGHPEKTFPLTLTFAVPRAFHSEGMWNESVVQGDLPGLYAGIYISNQDAIQKELVAQKRLAGLPNSVLLSQPKLRMHSLGTYHGWFVNSSSYSPSTELGVTYNPAVSRGFFLLGPGSAVWLKHRYARLTHTQLSLTDAASVKGMVALPCRGRDERGRCIIHLGKALLQLPGKTLVTTDESTQIILDLDAYATTLPRPLLGSLMPAAAHSNAHVSWYPGGGQLEWPLVRARDVTPEALRGENGVSAITASDAEDSKTIVLGTSVISRLFSELVYDSSTATWYVCASTASDTADSQVVRDVFAVSIALLSYVIARQLLNPKQVTFREALESIILERPRTGPHMIHWAWSCAALVIVTVQIVMGQVYLPRGTCTGSFHADVLAVFGIVNSVAAGLFAVVHVALLFVVHLHPKYTTWTFEYMVGMTYVNLGLSGFMGALLPRSAKSFIEYILLTALLLLQLFFLVNVCIASANMVVRRFLARWDKRASYFHQGTSMVWAALALSYGGLAIAFVLAGGDIIIRETVSVLNTQLNPASGRWLAVGILCVVALGSTFVVHMEFLDVDSRVFLARQEAIEAAKKK